MAAKDITYLGIDGGGSRCRARIEDEHGTLLGEGISGPATTRVGIEEAWRSIMEAYEAAAAQAGLNREDFSLIHAGIGIAGFGRQGAEAALKRIVHPFASVLFISGIPTAVVSMPCRLLFEQQDAAYKKAVLGTTRARVAVEAAVELGWERYIGLEGRFVGMHSFGASGKIADVYKKFDINAEAVVRAAHETLADVAGL